MTSRERVELALRHKEPDRVPMDLGGQAASMTQLAYERLKEHLGITDGRGEQVSSWLTMRKMDERVLELFEVDFRRVFMKGPEKFEQRVYLDGIAEDEWGIRTRRIGPYSEMVYHPLAGLTLETLDDYRWPDPYEPGRVEGVREEAERLFKETDYAVSAGAVAGGLLETAWWLRGMENFLVDMVAEPEFAHEVLDRLCELEIGLWDVFLDEVGDYVQMVQVGDDLGTQKGPMISLDTYRSLVKPYHKRLNDAIHKKTKAKLFHHTCGSVYHLVEELIDVGVDVLNPVQPLAAYNDSFRLKEEFGGRICFHGGVDEQIVLPTGTTEEVEEEVKTRIQAFAPGGGYILAAAHNIQPDTPPPNVVAMFRAAKKYGEYPIQQE